MPVPARPSGGGRTARELVDLQEGLVSREIFVSEGLYQREQEQIFARCWLFVGHESQVPNPGDYFASCMGEEGVILVRDHHRRLHVFLNTCRHRGMKVCRYDEGNTSLFTCPYHGWSYGTDGRLAGVPYFEEAYRSRLDKSRWGLIEAQLATYKGSIWATWDPNAPSFLDYLGEMRHWLDTLVDFQDGREAGAEAIGGVQKWRIPCNWKFVSENFIGDMHHGGPTHASVEQVEIVGRGQTRHGTRKNGGESRRDGLVSFPELGHGARGSYRPDDRPPREFDQPAITEYYQRVSAGRARNLQGKPRGIGGGGIFPNFSFHSSGFPRTIAVAHPRGPRQTEIWRWYLVDSDAPDEVKDFLRHYYLRYSGPAGLTEQDDMENWNYAASASSGTIARRYPYNYSMGLGLTRPVEALHGAVITEEFNSEENARTFYRHWAELMDQ